MPDETALRKQIARTLDWEDAHAGFDAAVEGLAPELRGKTPPGCLTRPGSWSSTSASRRRTSSSSANQPATRRRSGRRITGRRARRLQRPRPGTSPSRFFGGTGRPGGPHGGREDRFDGARTSGTGQTYLREVLLVADHTAYHVGELIVVRRLLGVWKKRDAGMRDAGCGANHQPPATSHQHGLRQRRLLRRAVAAQESGVRGHGDDHACARHRREHGDLQRRQRRAPPAAAIPARGPPASSPGATSVRERRRFPVLARRRSATSRNRARLFEEIAGCDHRPSPGHGRRWAARAGQHRRRDAEHLPAPRRAHRLGRDFTENDATPQPRPPQARGGATGRGAAPPPRRFRRSDPQLRASGSARFGGDRTIVGKTIDVGGERRRSSASLAARRSSCFPPRAGSNARPTSGPRCGSTSTTHRGRTSSFASSVGLKPGVTIAQANSAGRSVAADLAARFPIEEDGRRAHRRRADAASTWSPRCARRSSRSWAR